MEKENLLWAEVCKYLCCQGGALDEKKMLGGSGRDGVGSTLPWLPAVYSSHALPLGLLNDKTVFLRLKLGNVVGQADLIT